MIKTISDIFGEFHALFDKGGLPRGISAGWPSIDPLYTIRKGEWTLVTGIPGHGKSSWLDNVIVNTARDNDWKWLVFSAENQPAVRHAANLAEIYIGRPFSPQLGRMTEDEWLHAAAFLDTQVRFYEPSEFDCNVESILFTAEGFRIDALVIDPWNELDHSRPQTMTETEYISESLSKVRRFAREHKIHIFIVAHPSKLVRQKTVENDATVYPVPTPYDVSGSAHWRNKADNAICVWRDVLDPICATQIHIQKIRFREVGQVGLGKLYYDTKTGRFNDPLVGVRKPFSVEEFRRELDAKIERHEQEREEKQERLAIQEASDAKE